MQFDSYQMISIGSGSLPISFMVILNEYASFTDIYNIDMSKEANQLLPVVCQRLLPIHLFMHMHFITYDISHQPIPSEIHSILKECQLIYSFELVAENKSCKI